MTNNLKVYFKSLKGKFILTFAGISTGAVVMSGCNGEIVATTENPSEVITSEVPSEIEEISEEPSEIDPIDEKYPDPFELDETYSKIPEELLDENGLYHPAEITEEQLRGRIEEIGDRYDASDRRIMMKEYGEQIIKANLSYISDDIVKKIMKEYDISSNWNGANKMSHYPKFDIPNEMFFDPYLQYTSTKIYNLSYKRYQAENDGDKKAYDKFDKELFECVCGDTAGTTYKISKSDKVPIYLDGSNLYDKFDFKYPFATYSIIYDNYVTKQDMVEYEKKVDEIIDSIKKKPVEAEYVLKR